MTRYNTPRLLTPPREEEEIYPYRPVWSSIIIELGGLFGLTIILYILVGYIGVNIADDLRRPVNVFVAIFPAILWGGTSRWRERLVVAPRENLLTVFVVSALAANAVGIPFIREILQPDLWLSPLETIDRITGYMMTTALIQELVKYLVVRFAVGSELYRVRLDALAYAVAAAFGYAMVGNLYIAFNATPSPDVVAINVCINTTIHVVGSAFVAYGLAEVYFNPRSIIVLPFFLFFSTFITGIAISTRTTIVNAQFFLGAAATRPLFVLIFSLALVVIMLSVVAFLFNVAERQEREAIASREG